MNTMIRKLAALINLILHDPLGFVVRVRSTFQRALWDRAMSTIRPPAQTALVPEDLKAEPHIAGVFQGPWIENVFDCQWRRIGARVMSEHSSDWVYVPVYWTDLMVHASNTRDMVTRLEEFVEDTLDESGRYFTLVQHDNGVPIRERQNLLVFGAGGVGDIAIPLLKGDLTYTSPKRRVHMCSFMGATARANDRTGVRSRMVDTLKDRPGYYFGNGSWTDFVRVSTRSRFVLAPRGYGRTSFRLYEAIALGTIPVYVWDDIEWLPFKPWIEWDKAIISIQAKQLDELPMILESISDREYRDRLDYLRQIHDEYLSYNAVCRSVQRILLSDCLQQFLATDHARKRFGDET